MVLASGTVERIIPRDTQMEIVEFWVKQRTGQVSLNFHEGRILSNDSRKHFKSESKFCSNCRLPINPGDKGWRVIKKKPYCQDCS